MMTRTIKLLFILACLAGPAGLSSQAAAPEDDIVAYQLGSGDRVKVTVFGETDLSGEFVVAGDGTLSLPLIGEVRVVSKTIRELENTITVMLKDGFLRAPQVSAEVVNYRPFYILGEIKRPGSYAFVNGMTVLNAVALGGGFTYRARQDPLYITRAADPDAGEQSASPETLVLPGDVVRVRQRYF